MTRTDQDPREKFIAPALFAGLAVVYNAILAFLNAHVIHVSQSTVIVVEGMIVLGAVGYMTTRLRYIRDCHSIFLFQFAMLVIFLGVTVLSEFINVKAFRDIFLITVFTLLGSLVSEKILVKVFLALSAIILFFLLMEAYATNIYAMIFNPASYYASTRGMDNPDFNDSGLFVSALSFGGRFSLGIFDVSHRLSSIFIEQVSLGNFAIVLAIFTSLFWDSMRRPGRILSVLTILLILPMNNSRTALALCCVVLAGHFIFPRLPRYTHLLYFPVALLLVLSVFDAPECIVNGVPTLSSDDLVGRLGFASCTLKKMEIGSLVGMESELSRRFWDSGYVYFINAQSLAGMIVFWLYCSLLIRPASVRAIRMNHYLALAIFINMFTSMALFSIKVCAALWFMAGFLYRRGLEEERFLSDLSPDLSGVTGVVEQDR